MTAHRPLNHEESQQQLFAALHALRRRLRWRDNVHALTRWGWALLLPALAVALLAFVQPIANAWLWTALAVGALLGWLLWSLLRPLSLARVARRVDAEAQTHERLATALELGAAHNRDPYRSASSRMRRSVPQRGPRIPHPPCPGAGNDGP